MTTPTQQTPPAHTATPWKVINYRIFTDKMDISICDPYEGRTIKPNDVLRRLQGEGLLPIDERAANAAFIVTACNSFDSNKATIKALAEALERTLDVSTFDKRAEGMGRFGLSLERTNEIIAGLEYVIQARAALAAYKQSTNR